MSTDAKIGLLVFNIIFWIAIVGLWQIEYEDVFSFADIKSDDFERQKVTICLTIGALNFGFLSVVMMLFNKKADS